MPRNEWCPVPRQNSRVGCAQCKERRIKCDAAKPACLNCVSKGHTCPGYSTTLRWKEKHQFFQLQLAPPNKFTRTPTEWLSSATSTRARRDGSFQGPSLDSEEDTIRPESPVLNTTHPLLLPENQSSNSGLASASMKAKATGLWSREPGRNEVLDLAPRTPGITQVPAPMPDRQMALVWHYFQSVCVINSCYDSDLDPLRVTTRELMSSSRLIYFCVLSMSAAHRRRDEPQLALDGAEYLAEAVSTLRRQLAEILAEGPGLTISDNRAEQTLLGVIILGMTTSWHGSSGLGLEHIKGSRALLQQFLGLQPSESTSQDWTKLGFYLGLQAYWETVASFLLDQNLDQLDYLYQLCTKIPEDAISVHPWTGVSSTLWILLAKAGCLARRKRACLLGGQSKDKVVPNPIELSPDLQQLQFEALALENQLLHSATPDVFRAGSTQDEQTPISHLEAIARCCKLAGLLELYRSFSSICDPLAVMCPLSAMDGTWCFETSASEPLTITAIYRMLSLNILKTLYSLPHDSNTRCLHPIFLLIAGSTLSTGLIGRDSMQPMQTHSAPSLHNQQPPPVMPRKQGNPHVGIDKITLDKANQGFASTDLGDLYFWRQFVDRRMTELEGVINLDVLRRMKTILHKVWACNDLLEATITSNNGEPFAFAYWMDIMELHHLEFLF